MFYSKSTNGFYDLSIHGNRMPIDAVEITDEVYVNLLNGQSSGKNITSDESGHPILVDRPPANYQHLREMAYPSFLDYIDGVVKNDQEQINAYIAACQAVKARFPKP
jgi:hypothetical protein